MLGIDNLKKLIDFLFAGADVMLTIDKDRDGKIEFGEIFAALTGGIAFQAPKIYSMIGDIKAEFKDLTGDELQELANYCKEKDYFVAEFDNLEEFIKKALLWLAYNARFFEYTKEFFTK